MNDRFLREMPGMLPPISSIVGKYVCNKLKSRDLGSVWVGEQARQAALAGRAGEIKAIR